MTASSPPPPPGVPGPASPPPPGPFPPAGPVPPRVTPGGGGGWKGLLPIVISAVAVFIALVSLGVAVSAVGRANDAKNAVATGAGGVEPAPDTRTSTRAAGDAPPPTTEAPPIVDPTSSEPPELNERTDYDVKYEKENLILLATTDSAMSLDVDEPRAQAPSQDADLSLHADYNAQRYFTMGDGVQASADGAEGMSPIDCHEKIRTAPLPQEARVPPRQGVVLCVLTSFAAAQSRGDQWRLARIEITGVRSDNAVVVELTAWNIPR